MKFLVLSLLVVAAVASPAFRGSSADETQFKQWMSEHSRNYESIEEYMKRFSIWMNNRDEIAKINGAQNDFELRLNHFADIDGEEFKFYFTGYNAGQLQATQETTLPTDNLPASMDWSQKGAVTPIKNQGQCGSCWSFSTTGSLEGLHFLKKGSLLSFSEQQLVDCSGSYGNMGCNGGLMDDAFKYVEAKGIELESDYPYTAEDGKCAYDSSKVQFTNTGYTDVPTKDEMQLKAAVAQQPVSVAVDAAGLAWQFYFGGVVTYFCGTSLDHGVLAVGYGTDSGKDYWKVKNSWGASWGEEGYIRLRRYDKADDGTCGIAMQPSYPTLS